MEQVYIRIKRILPRAALLLGFLSLGCQKDWGSISDFQPNLSVTFPLLNQNLPISSFGADTVAYGAVSAISLDLGPGAISVPLDRLNRAMGNRPGIYSGVLTNANGIINRTENLSVNSLLSNIQNQTLAVAFQQAIAQNSTPPPIVQNILKPNQITIGSIGGVGNASNALDVSVVVKNFQSAELSFKVRLRTPTDSMYSAQYNLNSGQVQNLTLTLSPAFSLPIVLELVDFTYTPLSTLNTNLDLLSIHYTIDEDFTSFSGMLDTVVWKSIELPMAYLDTLSLVAPRSEITFKSNTNFFYTLATNLTAPIFRRTLNEGNLLFEGAVNSGTTNQFPMGNKIVYGVQDTFRFENIFYSINESIPSNLTTKHLSLTEIHTFPKPIMSKVELKENIFSSWNQTMSSSFDLPFVDSARIFYPILQTDVSGDNAYDVSLRFFGTTFPTGPFQTDTIRQKLIAVSGNFHQSFVFDSTNSQLSNLITIPADSLQLGFEFGLNKSISTLTVDSQSKLKLNSKLIIPIDGKISALSFSDTVDVNIDSTLVSLTLADTILIRFGSSNPATLSMGLTLTMLDENWDTIRIIDLPLITASPYVTNISNGVIYVDVMNDIPVVKEEIVQMKQLLYHIHIGGDDQGMIRIPSDADIRVESSIVIP